MMRLPINRLLLKLETKARIRRTRPSPLLVAMIAISVFLLLEMLAVGVLGLTNIPLEMPERVTSMETYDLAVQQMNEQLLTFFEHYRPSPIALALAFALLLMYLMVRFGFQIYALRIARDEKADFGCLMDAFPIIARVLAMEIMRTLIIFVGSFLIIPGVILFYRYRQAFYLLAEHPDYSPVRCLKESGRLMRGRKLELFVLDVSFLGWYLLQSFLPYFGTFLGIWVLPYTEIAYAGYYCHIAGPRTAPDGKPFVDGEFQDASDSDTPWEK